jgi:hypothetical protein
MDDRERNDEGRTRETAEPTGNAPRDMGPDTARSKTIATPGGITPKEGIGVHGAAEGELDKAEAGSGAQQDAATGGAKAWDEGAGS